MPIKEFGYEYDATVDDELLRDTKGKCTHELIDGAYALRSGRDALKTVAREYKRCVVLLPSLACESMINPFLMYRHDVLFYRLNDKLEIDLPSLESLLGGNKEKTVLLLYMDYFGIKSISDENLRRIKKKNGNVVFINDITHTFLSFDWKERFCADYVLVSLRKWFPIPDGALLWCKKKLLNCSFSCDTSFFEKRLEAQALRHRYFETADEDLKTRYRKIFSSVSGILYAESTPSRMTEYSFELFKRIDVKTVKEMRAKNAAVLRAVLSKTKRIRLIGDEISSNLYVPFLVDDRDEKQRKLNILRIYNTIIWPLNGEQRNNCPISKYIEEHMLAAPCDQRYSEEDMLYIGREIVRIVNE